MHPPPGKGALSNRGQRPTISIIMKKDLFSALLLAQMHRFAQELNDVLAELREAESAVEFEMAVLRLEQVISELENSGA